MQVLEWSTNETWTSVLERAVITSDLVLSWWDKVDGRLNNPGILFLEPNVDLSHKLVTFKPTKGVPTLSDKWFTFLQPFDSSLWFATLVAIMLGGIFLYLVEFNASGGNEFDQLESHVEGSANGIFLSLVLFLGAGKATISCSTPLKHRKLLQEAQIRSQFLGA